MIASISQGGGFGGLFGYLLADEKSAKIIGGNVACRSVKGLTREFKAISDLNPQVTVVAKHIALAFAPLDGEIANSLKAEIAMRLLDELGYKNSQSYATQTHSSPVPHPNQQHWPRYEYGRGYGRGRF